VEKGDIKDNKYHNKEQLDIFIYYPIGYLGQFCWLEQQKNQVDLA